VLCFDINLALAGTISPFAPMARSMLEEGIISSQEQFSKNQMLETSGLVRNFDLQNQCRRVKVSSKTGPGHRQSLISGFESDIRSILLLTGGSTTPAGGMQSQFGGWRKREKNIGLISRARFQFDGRAADRSDADTWRGRFANEFEDSRGRLRPKCSDQAGSAEDPPRSASHRLQGFPKVEAEASSSVGGAPD